MRTQLLQKVLNSNSKNILLELPTGTGKTYLAIEKIKQLNPKNILIVIPRNVLKENWNKEYKTNKNKIQCSAPTISQVLKWLRKEKKILITIIPQEKNLGHDTLCFAVYKITEDLYQPIYNGTINTLVDSYEELYLAGIDYVLDNLI
mgnify:CR=1 FL=1